MSEPKKNTVGCVLGVVFVVALGGLGYGVFQAQERGAQALEEHAGPYLDALVTGDWAAAAAADHEDRELTARALKEAWTDRQARFGDLERWSTVVSQPGNDPNGAFVLSTVHLHFAGLSSPVALRVEVRKDGQGIFKVTRATPTSQTLNQELVW